MAFPKGNEYYKIRDRSGRDKIFETPEELADACNKYFEWVVENPLMESQAFSFRGMVTIEEVPKMRPFTLEGLCNFLGIHVETFKNYEKRDDFFGVTKAARQIIYNQKFEGAASGFLNANIIARDLGLADKQNHEMVAEIKPLEFKVIGKKE